MRLAKLEKKERVSGFPNPNLYDQYFVNSYSFPKGLHSIKWPWKQADESEMIINAPIVRWGV